MRFAFPYCACAVWGVRAQSFDLVWKLPLAGPPVVFAGGVAVMHSNGRIALVDPAGKETGSTQLDRAPAGPALVRDGRIYATDVWGTVSCVRLGGERLWEYSNETRAGSGYNSLVLSDVDGDGAEAVAFVTAGHDIGRQVAPIEPDYLRWMHYREQLIAVRERLL